MNPILAGIAIAVVAGTVVAVAARDARVTILGLAVVLIGTPVLADPIPDPLGLATRFVGAILAAYLLWVVARDQPRAGLPPASTAGHASAGLRTCSWPPSAAVVGFAAHGLGAPALGSADRQRGRVRGGGARDRPTVLTGRDVLRVGLGSLLLVDAGTARAGRPRGTPDDLEQLITSATLRGPRRRRSPRSPGAPAPTGPAGSRSASRDRGRRHREPDAHPSTAADRR